MRLAVTRVASAVANEGGAANGDWWRTQEEEYFQKKERELTAQLQQRVREQATRRRMAERTGVVDHELQELETLVTPRNRDAASSRAACPGGMGRRRVSDGQRALIIEAARACGTEAAAPMQRVLTALIPAVASRAWLTARWTGRHRTRGRQVQQHRAITLQLNERRLPVRVIDRQRLGHTASSPAATLPLHQKSGRATHSRVLTQAPELCASIRS